MSAVTPPAVSSVRADTPPRSAPRIVVLSSLFPSRVQPIAGSFVRERMSRVARRLPVSVVAPTPWFPFQSVLRRLRAGFRPGAPRHERQDGIDVWYPRYFSIPAIFKRCDGFFMALGAYPRLRALRRAGALDVLDAHFAYPDGYAASLLGRWLGVPVTITLRGKEARLAREPALRKRMRRALARASRVFTVSDSMRRVALELGAPAERIRVAINGVDTTRFAPVDRASARRELGLAPDARVLISVGGLVERKGFHRVLECLPAIRQRIPDVTYLIVGGPGPEGDFSARLRAQVDALGLADCVRFLGALPSEALRRPLSAADAFVLATSYEGWANVLLEAMACGLPVVTTDVGGNAEVVSDPSLGTVVAFGDCAALRDALIAALERPWDRGAIRDHAKANGWDRTVALVADELVAVASSRRAGRDAAPRRKSVAGVAEPEP